MMSLSPYGVSDPIVQVEVIVVGPLQESCNLGSNMAGEQKERYRL